MIGDILKETDRKVLKTINEVLLNDPIDYIPCDIKLREDDHYFTTRSLHYKIAYRIYQNYSVYMGTAIKGVVLSQNVEYLVVHPNTHESYIYMHDQFVPTWYDFKSLKLNEMRYQAVDEDIDHNHFILQEPVPTRTILESPAVRYPK